MQSVVHAIDAFDPPRDPHPPSGATFLRVLFEASHLEARVRSALMPIDTVRVAYLFGSRVRADARPDSDLDIGVAYPSTLDEREREQARRVILEVLASELGALGEHADVVDLENADSAVAFQAITQGRLVCERSATDRVRVVTAVARRYDDDAPKRALFRRAARAAVARMQGG